MQQEGRPMRIRDAQEDDFPAIQEIYAHHVLHGAGSFEEEPPGVEAMLARFAAVRARPAMDRRGEGRRDPRLCLRAALS